MSENLFTTFNISSQGLSVQRQRLSATARNIANINTTTDIDGKPYRREIVSVKAIKGSPFASELHKHIELYTSDPNHTGSTASASSINSNNVLKAQIGKDNTPPRLIFDPSHPDANEDGYVAVPNINIVTEMVEMIAAQRAFEANANVIESAKNMARDSLEI